MTHQHSTATLSYYAVYSITEYHRDGEVKHARLRVGAAFINKDGSFNPLLRALPLSDPRTDLDKLHMRLPKADAENDDDSFYLEIDPIMGAPLEAL